MTDFKKYTDLVYKIIGAAMKVHSEMNWGLQVSKGLVQDDPSGIYPEALEGKWVRRTCPSDPLLPIGGTAYHVRHVLGNQRR